MEDDRLLERWRRLWSTPTSGWDFSRFGDRMVVDDLPWSYDDLARAALSGAGSVLDLGTGGGEVLLSLADALPSDVVATEGWPRNLSVARSALAPLGAEVVSHDGESGAALPFADARFDVVLDRHAAYDAREVARVLRPGGVFLTQQVDGANLAELAGLFGGSGAYGEVSLESRAAAARAAGLRVDLAEEAALDLRVADVDTLVEYLSMVPWEVPDDFTVDRHAATLLALAHRGGPIVLTERRFVLRVRRPRALVTRRPRW